MRRLLRLLALLTLPLAALAGDIRAPLLVNYDAYVDGAELALYKTVILSSGTSIANLGALRQSKTRVLGYISLGEIASYEADAPELAKVPVLGENKVWHSRIPDVTHPDWANWVVDTCAAKIADRGWDGFFLDTLDSARLPDGLSESVYEAREKAMAGIITRLKAKHPKLTIVANRGFGTLRHIPQSFDAVLAEGVLSTCEGENRYGRVPVAEFTELREKLDQWKAAGKTVYALDYSDPEDRDTAAQLYSELESFGYEPLIATPDLLQDAAIAPLRRIGHRALVIFGSDIGKGLVEHAANGITNTTLNHPLMRHGYTLEYVNVRELGFPANLDKYDLVVIEPFDPVPSIDMKIVARRLADRLRSRKKTIFLDSLKTWTENDAVWNTLSAAAGWSGSGAYVTAPASAKIRIGDKDLLKSEGGATPRSRDALPDLRAPKSARVLIRQGAETAEGESVYDSAFAARFGGVIVSPWIQEIDPIGRVKSRVDFFAFVDRVLGAPEPAFDTTTRAGCRLFFAHIDGDGLHAMSKVTLGKLSGEIMRDEIYKKYPIPFASSVITGEIRGITAPRPDKKEVERRAEVARSIFALPNVEVACHTHTHPFAWTDYNVTSSTYSAPRLKLLPEYDKPMDYREETVGAVEYINKHLCPPGKSCKLFLWSGNCLPPPEAVAHLESIGLPNMNGMATDVTYDNPFLANIRGGSFTYDGSTQVAAPFENDNVYYDMEKDGLEGGFARVIEAFEITGSPRRLLPVNAYWHFFSADTVERLRALRKVLDWACARPLHPIYASEYAAMMRDLPQGTRYEDTRGGHLFSMPPGCLTVRYEGTQYIDMRESTGVLGYRHELGVTYVHTDGSRTVRVILRNDDDRAPRLVYSTRPVAVTRLPRAWSVAFDGFAPGKARFAGFTPGGVVRTPGGTYKIGADGVLELEARPGERLEIPHP